MEKTIKIEALTLDDGRRAERHTSVDETGNEKIEIFAEEKRPLKLEKRIVREFKNIVAKEVHETIKDGEISLQEVHALEAEKPLEIRSRIGLADHAKIVDGDYVRKEELNKTVADAVVAGVSILMEQQGASAKPEPLFRAQSIVEKNVEEKKSNNLVNYILGGVVAIQVLVFGYIYLI